MFHKIFAAFFALTLTHGLAAAGWQKLVGPQDLKALTDAGGVTVIDIRSPKVYRTAHIPGAVNAPYPAWRGPPTNPGLELTDEYLTGLLQTIGVTPNTKAVVAHAGTDQTDFGAAARVYWTLKSAGLTEIAILNGGVRGWVAAGQPLSVDPVKPAPSTAKFTLSDQWMIKRDGIAEVIAGNRASTMIDARPAAFYQAKKKHPAASKPGTLAGSLNTVHSTWFDGNSPEVATVDKVRDLARAAGYTGDEGELVSFCNTGHWAATNWFALSELAGAKDVKLYPESIVGWASSGGALSAGK